MTFNRFIKSWVKSFTDSWCLFNYTIKYHILKVKNKKLAHDKIILHLMPLQNNILLLSFIKVIFFLEKYNKLI